MEILSKYGLQLAAVAIVLVGITGYVLFKGPSAQAPSPSPAPAPAANQQTSTAPTPPPAPTPAPSLAPTPSPAPAPQPPAKPATVVVPSPAEKFINISAPAANEKWVRGEKHTITWNQAADVTGGIYLVNAISGQTVGWILANTGQNQTSYSWNTLEVSLTRTGGTKIDIGSGDYLIKLTFDGKHSEVASGRFSVVFPNDVSVPMSYVFIKDYTFLPGTLTVKQGDKVVFVNQDGAKHRVVSTRFGPLDIAAGESYTLDSKFLPLGSYTYYSDIYSYMTPATLTVTQP